MPARGSARRAPLSVAWPRPPATSKRLISVAPDGIVGARLSVWNVAEAFRSWFMSSTHVGAPPPSGPAATAVPPQVWKKVTSPLSATSVTVVPGAWVVVHTLGGVFSPQDGIVVPW